LIKENPLYVLSKSDGSEVTRPHVKLIPSESVIPIIMKGGEGEAHGYIIVLDGEGYPVSTNEKVDFDKDLRSLGGENSQQNAQITKIANTFSNVKVNDKRKRDYTSLYNQFNKILENNIYNSLLDKSYIKKFSLKEDRLISNIMFHRYLSKRKTKLLYVPDQLMNYACFEKDEDGFGVSFINRTKMLSTLSTVLFFSNFMGNMINAIPRKEVLVDFDDGDIDPHATLETIIGEMVFSQAGGFDFNFHGPTDLITNIQRAGISYKLKNLRDTNMPEMDIEINDVKRDIRPIDSDFLELLQKMICMRMGFSHEFIDTSFDVRFSSQVVRENDLNARRVSNQCSELSNFITDYIVKYTMADPILTEECLSSIKGKGDKQDILEGILVNLKVKVPDLLTNVVDDDISNVAKVVESIDTILDVILSDSMLGDTDNESRVYLEEARELLKSNFMLDYVSKNTVFKPIIDVVINSDELNTVVGSETERKIELMKIFAKHFKKIVKADDKITSKLGEEGEGGEEGTPPEEEGGEGGVPPEEEGGEV
jgi:hypothetical protein